MTESYLNVEDEVIYVRHDELVANRPSVLLVHGLGASGLCFGEAFEHAALSDVNRVAVDLVGFGRSSASSTDDYRFERQVERLWYVVDVLELDGPLVLVGHSMGGDIGTLMCASDSHKRISSYVNVEGNLTRPDMMISGAALRAERRGRFERWLHKDFAERFVYDNLCRTNPSTRNYYASLRHARQEAFLQSCHEIDRYNATMDKTIASRIGDIYCSLTLPKLFCYGTESVSRSSARLLVERDLERRAFEGAGHFVMGERPGEFYALLGTVAAAASCL